MSKLNQGESRNHSVWLKYFIKAMKESLKTGSRFHPRDDDVGMLQQIREMIQKPEITEEWIEAKAGEMIVIILHGMKKDAIGFIRSLLKEDK